MTVHQFNVEGLAFGPAEAQSPLVIDADAVLTGPVAGQRLQPLTGRDPRILEINRAVQLRQFPVCDLHDVVWHTLSEAPLPS